MKTDLMNDAVRKFTDIEPALIACGQYADATVLIGDGFYAVGRKFAFGFAVLRVSGFMVSIGKVTL